MIRSVSPIHLEYLLNMGVVASMSLSIIMRGELWGLIACHHRTPRFLPHRLRMACELFAQMASWRLEIKVAGEDFDAHLHCKRVHEELVKRISREGDLAEGLTRHRPNLLDYIPADGVGLWIDGQFTALGHTPAADEVAALVAWLNKTAADGVYPHRPPAAGLSPGGRVRRRRQRPDRAFGFPDAARLRAVVPPGGGPHRHLGRQPEQAGRDRFGWRDPDPTQKLRRLAGIGEAARPTVAQRRYRGGEDAAPVAAGGGAATHRPVGARARSRPA